QWGLSDCVAESVVDPDPVPKLLLGIHTVSSSLSGFQHISRESQTGSLESRNQDIGKQQNTREERILEYFPQFENISENSIIPEIHSQKSFTGSEFPVFYFEYCKCFASICETSQQ